MVKSLAVKLKIPYLDITGLNNIIKDAEFSLPDDILVVKMGNSRQTLCEFTLAYLKQLGSLGSVDQYVNLLSLCYLVGLFWRLTTWLLGRVAWLFWRLVFSCSTLPSSLVLWYTSDIGENFLDDMLPLIQHFSAPQRQLQIFNFDRSNEESWMQLVSKTSKLTGLPNIAIYCPMHSECETLVNLSIKVKLLQKRHYIFMSPNAYLELVDSGKFGNKLKPQYLDLNATIWLPHDREDQEFKIVENDWKNFNSNRDTRLNSLYTGDHNVYARRLSHVTSNIYDALSTYLAAIIRVDNYQWKQRKNSKLVIPRLLTCDNNLKSMRQFWDYGYPVAKELRTIEMKTNSDDDKSKKISSKVESMPPLTGDLLGFDRFGQRKGGVFHIYKSFLGQWKKFGLYQNSGLKITALQSDFSDDLEKKMKKLTLTVTTVLDAPYVMKKPKADRRSPDDLLQGYCIDLLEKLSQMNGFEYSVYIVDDGNYGSPQSDGTWNGMIGDLISGNADIAVAPLTITYERESVADFTKPFMTLGVSILYRKPLKEDPGPFSFMEPLSPEVWCSIGISYIIVVISLFVFSRLTPYEWTHFTSQPQTTPIEDVVYVIEDPKAEIRQKYRLRDPIRNRKSPTSAFLHGHATEHDSSRHDSGQNVNRLRGPYVEATDGFNENNYYVSNIGIRDSFWFGIGGLMQQGSEINPRAVSTRILASFWWFFALIITMYYTANLAAFLTVERMDSPINSADDLAAQTRISYGTLKNGATEAFFKNSKIDTFKKMSNTMNSDPDSWVTTNREGIDRVKNSTNYAFLMESTTLQYETARDCNITQIGGLLDSKGYGIAVGKTNNIIKNEPNLRDKLSMAILQLNQNGELEKLKEKWWKGSDCPKEEMRQNSLGLKAIGGVFVFLAFGICLSLIASCCEFCTYTCVKAAKRDTPWRKEIQSNMKRSTSWNHKEDFKKVMQRAKNIKKHLSSSKSSLKQSIDAATESDPGESLHLKSGFDSDRVKKRPVIREIQVPSFNSIDSKINPTMIKSHQGLPYTEFENSNSFSKDSNSDRVLTILSKSPDPLIDIQQDLISSLSVSGLKSKSTLTPSMSETESESILRFPFLEKEDKSNLIYEENRFLSVKNYQNGDGF